MAKKIILIEPPFYRLYKSTYSLEKYPLAIGYLGAVVSKNTSWETLAYNADFTPGSEYMTLRYLVGPGFKSYLENLKDASYLVWEEVRRTIREFNPDVVGISAKTQNFKSACMVARIAKQINPSAVVILGGPHPSMVRGKSLADCPEADILAFGEGEATILEISARESRPRPGSAIPPRSFREGC